MNDFEANGNVPKSTEKKGPIETVEATKAALIDSHGQMQQAGEQLALFFPDKQRQEEATSTFQAEVAQMTIPPDTQIKIIREAEAFMRRQERLGREGDLNLDVKTGQSAFTAVIGESDGLPTLTGSYQHPTLDLSIHLEKGVLSTIVETPVGPGTLAASLTFEEGGGEGRVEYSIPF